MSATTKIAMTIYLESDDHADVGRFAKKTNRSGNQAVVRMVQSFLRRMEKRRWQRKEQARHLRSRMSRA